MRLYTVHVNAEAAPDRRLLLVPEGFSLWAAVFTVAWALWHRLWIVAILFILVDVVMMTAMRGIGLDDALHPLLTVGLAILFGFLAGDLRRWTLGRGGYELRAVVSGADMLAAERRFLDHQPYVLTEVAG